MNFLSINKLELFFECVCCGGEVPVLASAVQQILAHELAHYVGKNGWGGGACGRHTDIRSRQHFVRLICKKQAIRQNNKPE